LRPSSARTDPDAADPRLRTARLDVPFARVWDAVLGTVGATPRWTPISADPREGEVQVEARTLIWQFVDDVRIRVHLDEEGRTAIDVHSTSRVRGWDMGTHTRRIARFLHHVRRRVADPETRPD
jgi:uncharacterized protein (DUF1499 family)